MVVVTGSSSVGGLYKAKRTSAVSAEHYISNNVFVSREEIIAFFHMLDSLRILAPWEVTSCWLHES
jgi:hypothetical protein